MLNQKKSSWIGKDALIELFGKEDAGRAEKQEWERDIKELKDSMQNVQDILDKIIRQQKQSKKWQDDISIRMLKNEETLKILLKNQIELGKNIDKLTEFWSDKHGRN